MPDSTKKSLRRCLGLFLCASRQVLLPGRFQANVQHCTWLGSPMCAASGGSSTWGNTWESRTLPDSTKKSLRRCLGLFLCASRQVLLPGRFQANVQHCTWLGSPMCAASGGSSTWGERLGEYDVAEFHEKFCFATVRQSGSWSLHVLDRHRIKIPELQCV